MVAAELRSLLKPMQLGQNQLAALLGVTTRAVGMWVNGEREVPGPVAAYVNLLRSLPRSLFEKELNRLENEPELLDGMYLVEFAGADEFGVAMLVMKDGTVFGSDNGGVLYDGTYERTGVPGEVLMTLTLTVPAGVALVQGIDNKHHGLTFAIAPQKFNLLKPDDFTVATPVLATNSVVKGRISKVRTLPRQ